MTNKNRRRESVLRSLHRKRSWEVETAKTEFAEAYTKLDEANIALEESDQAIKSINLTMRQLLENNLSGALSSMEMFKHLLEDKEQELKKRQQVQLQTKFLAEHKQENLKSKLLNQKGIERVLEVSQKTIAREQDKKDSRIVEESWLQRNGGDQ